MNYSRVDIWDDLSGEVILPGSRRYEEQGQPAIARFHDVVPKAVVRCRSTAEVVEVISLAKRHGIETAIRSGGHSFAGYSSTEGVVIDLSPMRSVSVSNGLVTAGAGTRLAEVYNELQKHDLTIPAGCGPTVGISGLTLGGGLGILGRKYGLTADHLVGATVVLADGRVVECDETHHPDLFWALRGAGAGSFGVVTSLVFSTIPNPESTVFHLVWPDSLMDLVIDAWQKWSPSAPDGLAASLLISTPGDPERNPVVNIFGSMAGTAAETHDLITELVNAIGNDPTSVTQEQMTFGDIKRYLNHLGDGVLHGEPQSGESSPEGHAYSKSEFFQQALPPEAITKLVENLQHERTPGVSHELDFTPWGGAYNDVAPDDTAFVHREELFLLKQTTVVPPDATAIQRKTARAWLEHSWSLTHPFGTGGVYPNFPDPDLDDWGHAYYGDNYERLIRVKSEYDPDGFFTFEQSIPGIES